MENQFSSNLRQYRKARNLSQEQMAEALGISSQAVSKWECALCYPDVELLPVLADLLEVTIDELLRKESSFSEAMSVIPNDEVIRIVQFCGRKVIGKDDCNANVKIPLSIPKELKQKKIHVEIWGSAEIKGNISGGLDAKGDVACGNVSGGVDAKGSVNCGNVSGGVDAKGHVNCGNISGGLNVKGNVNSGMISGGVNVENGDIHCQKIEGEVHCSGTVYYTDEKEKK